MPKPTYSINASTYREIECTTSGHNKWWAVVQHADGQGWTAFWGLRTVGRPSFQEKREPISVAIRKRQEKIASKNYHPTPATTPSWFSWASLYEQSQITHSFATEKPAITIVKREAKPEPPKRSLIAQIISERKNE